MKIYWKVFLAVFISTSSIGGLVIWASYKFMSHWTTKEYLSRYSAFSTVLGDALSNLDVATEASMRNAAELVAKEDDEAGTLPIEKLKSMRSKLNVTHIFQQNNNGDFIRSTNDDTKRIPNAFTFCDQYRRLVSGQLDMAATPLIRPYPEIAPYKFLYVPNKKRTRLIEVGVRVDLVAETLTKALGADPNLLSISLYSPIGEIFGRFSSSGVQYSDKNESLPARLPHLADHGDTFRYFVKIQSSHPKCCQCDVAGTSRNGEYYYVLESEISKRGLAVVQATMNKAALVLGLILFFMALFISRFVSRRLVSKIEDAVRKIKAIMAGGEDRRLHLKGQDEVAYLADQFDSLLDQFEESQTKLVESEKLKTKVQMAREIAHNIKSPTVAIEMVMPMLAGVPKGTLKILADSASEIRNLANRLMRQADEDDVQSLMFRSTVEPVLLKPFLESMVEKKSVEHGVGSSLYLIFRCSELFARAIVAVDATELSAVISNLINNASEAYPGEQKTIHIVGNVSGPICTVAIKDFGRGIPKDLREKLGSEEVTFGKPNGRGIGLLHAFKSIRNWNGRVIIESQEGVGTTVTVSLPCVLAGEIAASEHLKLDQVHR